MLALPAGGAEVALCSANPLSTQDDVAAALVYRARRRGAGACAARTLDTYAEHVRRAARRARPQITIDDGADLLMTAHELGGEALERADRRHRGDDHRARAAAAARRSEGRLACPVLAVNEARTERALNDRHGTGQSALDGIVRASNVLLAGHTIVVVGYGWAGQGIAERARGAGAAVIVCEVDPLRALEARMAGYEVMPALEAAERGDMFVTVTGSRRVLRGEHFERMKDGALLANAGHFDVELDLDELRALATGRSRPVRPLVEQYRLGDGRRLNLLAQGRVVNLAAAEGHPAAVMDVSFALQALCVEELVRRRRRARRRACMPVPGAIDREVATAEAGRARGRDRRADARAGALPRVLDLIDRGSPPAHAGSRSDPASVRMLAHARQRTAPPGAGSTSAEPRSRRSSSTPATTVLGSARRPTPTEGGPAGRRRRRWPRRSPRRLRPRSIETDAPARRRRRLARA